MTFVPFSLETRHMHNKEVLIYIEDMSLYFILEILLEQERDNTEVYEKFCKNISITNISQIGPKIQPQVSHYMDHLSTNFIKIYWNFRIFMMILEFSPLFKFSPSFRFSPLTQFLPSGAVLLCKI